MKALHPAIYTRDGMGVLTFILIAQIPLYTGKAYAVDHFSFRMSWIFPYFDSVSVIRSFPISRGTLKTLSHGV
jgi:hypothetical protein